MKNSQPKNTYKGGAEVFKGYVRLSSNENNYGPAKSVKSLIKKNINNNINFYFNIISIILR